MRGARLVSRTGFVGVVGGVVDYVWGGYECMGLQVHSSSGITALDCALVGLYRTTPRSEHGMK